MKLINEGKINIHSSLCQPICTAPPLDQQQYAGLVHHDIQEPKKKRERGCGHQSKHVVNMHAIIMLTGIKQVGWEIQLYSYLGFLIVGIYFI